VSNFKQVDSRSLSDIQKANDVVWSDGLVDPRPAMRRKEERNVHSSLKRHSEIMNKYISEGMSKEEASKKGGPWKKLKKPKK
jgi:hypothetical protein